MRTSTYKSFYADVEKLKEKYVPTISQENSKEFNEAPPVVGYKKALQPDIGLTSTPKYRDTPLSQCKGRKKILSRFKAHAETRVKKQRTCTIAMRRATTCAAVRKNGRSKENIIAAKRIILSCEIKEISEWV